MSWRKRVPRWLRRHALLIAGCAVATAAAATFVVVPLGCRSGGGAGVAEVLKRPLGRRPAPIPLPRPARAVWVARFHYRYADDVRTILENCAALGCNTVLWQVRGEGTVSYPSQLEPWGREYDFRDPGFDPLALAVEAAHRNGLRIEAYVNVMPGWKGRTPPPVPQLFTQHPEWFLHDAEGRPQPPSDNYLILNPCLPEVRQHITDVVDEIVGRYDVDGVHLDYVRYAWDDQPDARRRYPRDPRTLELFRRETGKQPDDDLGAWNAWRANQLTRLVGEIRETVNRRRPGATLTAAVWRNPQVGFTEYLQNSVAWLRTGLVDAVMPMAYSAQPGPFEDGIESYRSVAPGRRVVPGLGLYLQKRSEDMRAQLQRCMSWGGDWALFSYDSLYPTAADRGGRLTPQAQAERHMRRSVLAEFVAGQ